MPSINIYFYVEYLRIVLQERHISIHQPLEISRITRHTSPVFLNPHLRLLTDSSPLSLFFHRASLPQIFLVKIVRER